MLKSDHLEGRIAQLARVPGLHSGGCRFESYCEYSSPLLLKKWGFFIFNHYPQHIGN